jgi:Zn-finger nucleic acid-binding protein
MKCPVDQTDLQMMDRQNVEIDYCPRCRGVWLDRGELDKIVERVAGDQATPLARPAPQREHDDDRYRQQHGYQHGSYGYRRDDDDDDDDRYRRGRRRGWFGEMFDFD